MRALHILFLMVVVCLLYPEAEGGWYGWRPQNRRPKRMVKYTIRNQVKDPKFEESLDLNLPWRTPFIRIMERAANQDSKFRFSADYFNKELGYFVSKINGLAGNYTLDKSFWAFIKAPDTFLDKGVSSFFPRRGDHIIFEFRMGGHEETEEPEAPVEPTAPSGTGSK